MRNVNSLDIDNLVELRAAIESELRQRHEQIKAQLSALGKSTGSRLKGAKIPPKYRGPNGELWAGRGARPRWLTALVGKKRSIEKYRIEAE